MKKLFSVLTLCLLATTAFADESFPTGAENARCPAARWQY